MHLVLLTAAALAAPVAAPAHDLDAVPGPWDNQRLTLTTADGRLTLHALVAGPEDAPVVVLLHGFPDFSYGWRGVIPALAERYRVVAPDLRGYAASDRPDDGAYAMDRLVGDVEALVDLVGGGQPVHLVGHDWGALIAWNAAAHAPERYLTLTALSVPHPAAFSKLWQTSARQRAYRKVVRTLRLGLAPKLIAGMSAERRADDIYRSELAAPGALSDADALWYQAAFDSVPEVRAPLRYYHEAMVLPRRGKAPPTLTVTTPTLVLWGSEDGYALPELAAMSCAEVRARCEHEVFTEASHWLPWEQPEAVVARWQAFVGEQGATPEAPTLRTPDADLVGRWRLVAFMGEPLPARMEGTTWTFGADGAFAWDSPDGDFAGTWTVAAPEVLSLVAEGEPGPALARWALDGDALVVKLDDRGHGAAPADLSVDGDFDHYRFERAP